MSFSLPTSLSLSLMQKKDAEEIRQHCDTLNNILLAEFDYFSKTMIDDFELMTARLLKQQADFHRKVSCSCSYMYMYVCTSSCSDANSGGVSSDLSGGRVWLRWSFKALSLHPPQWIEGINSNALSTHNMFRFAC